MQYANTGGKLMTKSKIILSFIAAALTILITLPAFAMEGRVFKTKLPNGLTVLIEEEHFAPVVAVEMWVSVGGADETDAEAGLSHVFEHMLFKGTAKRKVGEIANAVESVGGEINAYTSFDKTVYHLAVPSRHFSTGLDIISDAIQNSSFDPQELKKELEVVLEELRMNDDSPARGLYKTLFAKSYSAHPYRRPVIGYEKVISGLNRDTILKFFKKWYVPNNMTLVITGDVSAKDALKAITEEFANFTPAPDPHTARPTEPPQKSLRAEALTQEIKEAHVGLAYHIPELRHPDTYAIDVMAGILGGGASSRLYKKLKMETNAVHSVSAYAMSLKEPGLFMVTSTLDAKDIEKAVPELLYEIKTLGLKGPTPEEMVRIKTNLESDFIYSRETMEGLASKLGHYETIAGSYEYETEYLEGVRRVTPEDVRRVVNTYLIDDNLTFAAILPKADKAVVSNESAAKFVNAANAKVAAETAKVKDTAATTKIKLENGITLIVKEAHENPIVSFYAAFPGGLRFETPVKNGIGNFTANMLTKGTNRLTREELAREIEGLAGGISGFSGWNSTGASGKFLSSNFDKGLSLFADIIINPSFPSAEVEKQRKDILASIKSQEDSLPSYTFKLLYKSLYKQHPYGMPAVGTKETISSLKREDLINRHEELFVPERMVLVIVGDVNADYAVKKVKALFNGFKYKNGALKTPLIEKITRGIKNTGDTKEKAQVNVGMGFGGAAIGTSDSYALKVLTEVLAGQGGRLFINLRDKESLAYSVSAFSREGVDPGVFGLYIACAPDKKDVAIAALLNELKKITTEKVTSEELNRAKNALIGNYEIGLQETSSRSSDMANNELYGLGYGYNLVYPKKIEAVTAEDVLKAGQKYITLDSYVISIVGPAGSRQEKAK
ncbi:insulinase family protein [bacterium]|nr:MAG: insulinase family protein [bacterium]